MDTLNQAIITLLRHNARQSISSIAQELKLSRTTIYTRLYRPEFRRADNRLHSYPQHGCREQPIRGITMIEVKHHNADYVTRALGGDFPKYHQSTPPTGALTSSPNLPPQRCPTLTMCCAACGSFMA